MLTYRWYKASETVQVQSVWSKCTHVCNVNCKRDCVIFQKKYMECCVSLRPADGQKHNNIPGADSWVRKPIHINFVNVFIKFCVYIHTKLETLSRMSYLTFTLLEDPCVLMAFARIPSTSTITNNGPIRALRVRVTRAGLRSVPTARCTVDSPRGGAAATDPGPVNTTTFPLLATRGNADGERVHRKYNQALRPHHIR